MPYTPIGEIGQTLGPSGARHGWVRQGGGWLWVGQGDVDKESEIRSVNFDEEERLGWRLKGNGQVDFGGGYSGSAAYEGFMRDYRAVNGDPYHFGRVFEDFGASAPTVFDRITGGIGAGTVTARSSGSFPNIPLGIMECRTDGSSSGLAAITTPNNSVSLDFTNVVFLSGAPVKAILVRGLVQGNTSAAGESFWREFCLTGTPGTHVGNAINFIGFYYKHDTSGGVWIARTESSAAGVTTANTSVDAHTTNPYLLEFLIQDGQVDYYINGVNEATITTNIPTADMAFQTGLFKLAGTTSKTLWVDWVEILYYKIAVPSA